MTGQTPTPKAGWTLFPNVIPSALNLEPDAKVKVTEPEAVKYAGIVQ
jgi:hypothetical protein